MEKNERKGNKRNRNSKVGTRETELGYYIVVTDTKEKVDNYFEEHRTFFSENMKDKISVKVENMPTKDLIYAAQKLRNEDPQYRNSWIVFDREKTENFEDIFNKAAIADINIG